MTPALNGWHPGEKAVQDLIHLPDKVPFTAITGSLPEQHRIFHSSKLHFLPTTTLDSDGRPWVSLLVSSDGKPGFISSPDENTLVIHARTWPGDPTLKNITENEEYTLKRGLISAVGLEMSTRRRNKFAGRVVQAKTTDQCDVNLRLHVNEALG